MSNLVRASSDYPGWDPNSIFSGADGSGSTVAVSGDVTGKINSLDMPAGSNISGWGTTGWKRLAENDEGNDEDSLEIAGHGQLDDDSLMEASRDSLHPNEQWQVMAHANNNNNNNKEYMQQIMSSNNVPDDSIRDSLDASENWKKVAGGADMHQIAPDDSIRDSLDASGNWKNMANPQSVRNQSPIKSKNQEITAMNNKMKHSYRNNNDDIEFDNRNASVIGIQRLFRGHIGRKQASRQQLYAERERLKSREKMKNELLKRIDLDPAMNAEPVEDNAIQILDDLVVMMKAHRKGLVQPVHIPTEQPVLNPIVSSPVNKVVDDILYPANVLELDEANNIDNRFSPSKHDSPLDDSLDVDHDNSTFPVEVGIYIDNTGGKENTAESSVSVRSINAEDVSYINSNNHGTTTYFSLKKVPSVEETTNKTPPKPGFSVKDLINLSPPAPLIENAKVRSPIVSNEEQLPTLHVPSIALPELSPDEKAAIYNKQQYKQQSQVVHPPPVNNHRALMQARRANAAITIQRVYRGHIARLLARKRKAIWIHKYQCTNCKRVEQGGAYCKGCGHRKNQSSNIKTPRSYSSQYSNNPQNAGGNKIPRPTAGVSSLPSEPVVPVSRPPVVVHKQVNNYPAVEQAIPAHNPPPNRPRQTKAPPEKARLNNDPIGMENTLQMSAMERKLLMELEELDNIRQHNIELELQELDRQRVRIGNNNNQERLGRDERDGKKRAISEPPKSPRRVAATQKKAPDVVKEKEKKAFGPGARDFRPPRPRPAAVVEAVVKPSNNINHEEVQRQWEAAIAIDIHKPNVVEHRDPISNLGLPMKSPNAGIAEIIQGPSSYLREYHKRAHKPKKSNRDGASVNTNDDDNSTAVSSYYAYSEAAMNKKRDNNQEHKEYREETSSLPAISNRKTTSAPPRINSGVVKLPLIKA